MKKIFIAILGVAAFAACSQEMTLETPKGAAIAFDNAFVENATRAADYTADNITDFSVYGFITKDTEGAIFTDQKVAGSNAAGFTYSPAQYWVGGATYSFSALVPYEGRHWEYAATNSGNGVISFNNQTAVANQDLLFAYATRTTEASITAAPEAVAFTFDHVLSRVKFSFVNGFGDGQNITLKVTNVNITNAYAKGTLALENGVLAEAWTPAEKNLNVAFGDAGQELAVNKEGETTHYYLIPAEDTYEVTFTVAIYQSEVLVDTYDRTATVTVALERGKSYDLQATLTANNTSDDGALYPIEFTVTVNDWVDAPAVSAPLSGNISGQTLLTDATAANLELNGSFDGAGHTLVADTAAEWTIVGSTLRFINAKGDSSISNLTIDGQNLVVDGYGIRALFLNGEGEYTVDNVVVRNVTYAINVNTTQAVKLDVTNSVLEGWTSYGDSTTASFKNVSFECGKYANFKPYSSVVLTNCKFQAGFMIDFTEIKDGETIKFVNCKYNDVVLNTENIAQVAKLDGYAAEKVAFE